MGSDKGRTLMEAVGPEPDYVSELLTQLLVCARIGLVPTRLVARQRSSGDLTMLFDRFGGHVPEISLQAVGLAERIADACNLLGLGQVGNCARALFGLGAKALPFPTRQARAAAAWSEDIQVDSWVRRHRPEVLREVLLVLTYGVSTLVDIASADVTVRRAPFSLEQRNQFRPVGVEVESVVDTATRLPVHTDWRRRLVPECDGLREYLIRSRAELNETVVPIDETIVSVEGPLGLDRNGSVVWRLYLPEPTKEGRPISINYRKSFWGEPKEPVTSGILSYAAKDDAPIEWLNLAVEFVGDGSLPFLCVRFVTPVASLPLLRGRYWKKKLMRRRLEAVFETLQPNSSHGLYWWFEPDEALPYSS